MVYMCSTSLHQEVNVWHTAPMGDHGSSHPTIGIKFQDLNAQIAEMEARAMEDKCLKLVTTYVSIKLTV